MPQSRPDLAMPLAMERAGGKHAPDRRRQRLIRHRAERPAPVHRRRRGGQVTIHARASQPPPPADCGQAVGFAGDRRDDAAHGLRLRRAKGRPASRRAIFSCSRSRSISAAPSLAFSRSLSSSSPVAARVVRAASPAVRKASCQPVSVAAVTPSSRETVSRSSPRNNRSTAAVLRWRDILPPRPSTTAPHPGARSASPGPAPTWFICSSMAHLSCGNRPLARCPNQPCCGGQTSISAQEVLAGLVERVTYHNAENGFCVLRVKARGHRELATAVGHAATISAGEWITASGEWVNDRTHGQQFKARFLRSSAPTSTDGIEKYLASGMIRGIGPVYAKKLVKAFGADALQIMSENPYRLARDIRGIGFKTADAIAMRLGIDKAAMVRVRAGISYALTEAMDEGHCGLPADELVPLAAALLEVPPELVQTALELELVERSVIADTVGEKSCIFLTGLYRAEQVVADRLRRLAQGALPWPEIDPEKALPWIEGKTDLSLADSQTAATQLALESKVLVITGGP